MSGIQDRQVDLKDTNKFTVLHHDSRTDEQRGEAKSGHVHQALLASEIFRRTDPEVASSYCDSLSQCASREDMPWPSTVTSEVVFT
jgi:hypothetical protein